MASWKRPPGRPRNVWLNNVYEYANSIPLSTLWRSEISRGHGVAQRSTPTTTMMMLIRVVFEAETSGGEVRQVVSPTIPFSLFPPLPLSIPPKFSDKPVGGKVRSSEGEVPRLPPPTNTTLSASIT